MTIIDVREPSEEHPVGCIAARADRLSPEICFAVGKEYGDWYVSLHDVLFAAAGIEPARVHVASGRDDAERLVRLLAALYVKASAVDDLGEDTDDDEQCEGHESLAGEHMGESVYCDGSCRRAAS